MEKNQGFSLLEVLISIMIISIVFLGFAKIQLLSIVEKSEIIGNNISTVATKDFLSISEYRYLNNDLNCQEIVLSSYSEWAPKWNNYFKSIEVSSLTENGCEAEILYNFKGGNSGELNNSLKKKIKLLIKQ